MALTGEWRKASASAQGGNCAELRTVENGVEMRHSRDTGGPVLHFTPAEIDAFLRGAKDGEFDDLLR